MWLLVLAAIIALSIFRVWKDEENPLDNLPGPPRKPIIGCILTFMGKEPREMFALMRTMPDLYGDRYVVKIFKRRILHITSPKDIEVVLSHSQNITKNKPYRFMESWLGTGLLLSTGTKWHHRRKILTPTFHFNILKSFSKVIEEKSRGLVEELKKRKDPIDLIPVISDFTLFTICETAMGTQLDKDKSSSAVAYKTAILDIGRLLLNRLTRVWLHMDYIFKKTEAGRRYYSCLSTVHNFCDKVIMKRKEKNVVLEKVGDNADGSKRRLAMLDLLLEAESKGEIDLEGIREEVNTFMFEGHDTTAMAISFGLMLIADHEEVQDLIFEECRRIFGDTDHMPTMVDLGEMKYLEAVIKEVLRLYPSVPFVGRDVTQDFLLGDLQVKKGAEVGIHIYDLHRREDLYPEPEVFRPERFLQNDSRPPFSFVPFSAGPRNCIGQRFAMLEMKCVISEICRNFTLEPLVKGARPSLIADLVLRPADPMYVKFHQRQK